LRRYTDITKQVFLVIAMTSHVLIADRNKSSRDALIAAMPDCWQVNFAEACCASDAFAACYAGHAQIMFVDPSLLSAAESAELMDRVQYSSMTSIIFVSDETPEAGSRQAKASGAIAYLQKPVLRESLEPVLRGCGFLENE